MTIDVATDIGTRKKQEDFYYIQRSPSMMGCHVFDGHGGPEAAQLSATCLEADLLPIGDIKAENEEIVRGLQNINSRHQDRGTTLSSVYVTKSVFYISILGDSPVIYGRGDKITRVPLHEISNKEEVNARLAAGLVRRNDWPQHLFLPNSNSGLSCFRTIGDNEFGDKIGRTPDFYEIKTKWDWIIVATDGLKLPDQELLDGVDKGATLLIQQNTKFLTNKSIDNTTILLINK